MNQIEITKITLQMNIKLYNYLFIAIFLVFQLGCKNKSIDLKFEQHKDTLKALPKIIVKPVNKTQNEILSDLKKMHQPEIISAQEFQNFRLKSDYIASIEKYDQKYPLDYFGSLQNMGDIRYYELPTEPNSTQYGSNSFVFGDLNNDGKRDCVVTAIRSEGYNEVHFFYVFLNNDTFFSLVDVACEDDLSGYKYDSWPSGFRYQKIENGFFKGITFCHYNDAHCCPSLIFKAEAKLENDKLQYYNATFVMDDEDFMKYRPTPSLDSILFKSKIRDI
jgi:hypothetical protein